jgi:hypothetical protein
VLECRDDTSMRRCGGQGIVLFLTDKLKRDNGRQFEISPRSFDYNLNNSLTSILYL